MGFVSPVRLIAWLIFVVSLFGCTRTKISSGQIDEKNIVQINVTDQEINLNEFSSQLSIHSLIHLETTRESVFGEPTKVRIVDSILYVFCHSLQDVLMFSPRGRFLHKLDRKGKGPHEYLDLRDFQVYKDQVIAVLTYNKIMYYDSKLKHASTYNLGIKNNSKIYLNPTQFHEENKFYYLWNGTVAWENTRDRLAYLMYTSKNEQILKGYFPVTGKVISNIKFSESEKSVLINPTFGSNLVYRINNDKLDALYRIDFGKRNPPEKILKEIGANNNQQLIIDLKNSNYCLNIGNVLETTNYLYFQFSQYGIIKQGLYSKRTRSCKIGKLNPITKIECIDGDLLVALVQPIYLRDIIKNLDNMNLNLEIKELFSNLDFNNDENPIVVKYIIDPF